MKHLLTIVLYFLSEKHGLCGSLSESENNSRSDTFVCLLSDKVLLVGKMYFDKNSLVSMIFPHEGGDNLMFELMVKTNQKMNSFWLLLTNDRIHSKSKSDFIDPVTVPTRPDVYILPLHEQDELDIFETQLEHLSVQPSFNPKAVFVFLKVTNNCGPYSKPHIWVPYFSSLWKHNCLFVVVLVLSKCDFQLTIVKADPFSSENPCRSPNIQGINSHIFSPETEDAQFVKKSPKYFNGCSFVAAAASYPPFTFTKSVQKSNDNILLNYKGGLEIELIGLLSTKIGFTYEFDQNYYFDVTGCMSELANNTKIGIEPNTRYNKIELCFGGMTPNHKSLFRYDTTFTYMFSELSWFVADASVAPQWKIVFKVFSSSIWILLVFLNMTFSLVYNILDEHEYKKSKPIYQCKFKRGKIYVELFRTFLGQPSTLKPQMQRLRVLYFAWCVFSLHMSISFSTALFEHLRHPPVEKEITTIQDLYDSGVKVTSPKRFYNLFQASNVDSTTRSVLNNKYKCDNMEECFEELFRFRNFSIMDRYEHVRYLINLKKMKIHKIYENMVTIGVSILTSRGNPLTMEINKVVMQAFEAGLIKQWEKETSWKFRYKHNMKIPTEQNNWPLSVKDLQTALFLLTFGSTVSFSVFIVEIFLQSLKEKHNQKEYNIFNTRLISLK